MSKTVAVVLTTLVAAAVLLASYYPLDQPQTQ
jgi:hypothetical protein